jgi:SAM-dependent methyltransferase
MQLYDPFARYYDADFRDYLDDVPFYLELARRSNGPLLEPMCGTGRVLLPLAEAGYSMTGIDVSAAMLQITRDRAAEAGLTERIDLREADICRMELPAAHYGLAFVAVNSFMHLTDVAQQLAALETIRRSLKKRGTLVIDLFNPNPTDIMREDGRLTLERSYQLDGRLVQKFVSIDSDAADQLSHVTYLYDESSHDGTLSRRTMQFSMRWFYRFEMEHLLARAGFVLRQVYGSYDLEPLSDASPRMICVAGLR